MEQLSRGRYTLKKACQRGDLEGMDDSTHWGRRRTPTPAFSVESADNRAAPFTSANVLANDRRPALQGANR